jgi:hypothetical protein
MEISLKVNSSIVNENRLIKRESVFRKPEFVAKKIDKAGATSHPAHPAKKSFWKASHLSPPFARLVHAGNDEPG